MNLPEIRIRFSWLLYNTASPQLRDAIEPKTKMMSSDDCFEWQDKFQAAWKPVEKDILTGMCEVLDLEFYRKVIDVWLAPYFIPQSDPLIIGYNHTEQEFVDTLTHELIHVLLTDNNKHQIEDKPYTDLVGLWMGLYGKETDITTLVHIPVHAVHKHIYLNVLKDPTRLEADKVFCQKWPGYPEAWDYVENKGHAAIISELKTSYNKLKRKAT